MQRPKMDPAFQVHRLNEDGLLHAQEIASAFNDLLGVLERICPTNTREFSIVKTKLEESCFFAKKAMANVPAYQLVPETEAGGTPKAKTA